MKSKVSVIFGVLAMAFSVNAYSTEFCDGFAVGYKTIKGNNVIVPICPIEPITPIGSTPYQEGLKAGMLAARQGN